MYQWNLPTPEPTPVDVSVTFSCKWCGGERSVENGLALTHTCLVVHTPHEDMDFLLSTIKAAANG